VICDFIAPLPEMRRNFQADFTIWVDTPACGRFEDTDKLFIEPDLYDVRVTERDAQQWSQFILSLLLKKH
jgi:hypothetical protein